jgi:hypothetical protein
MFSRQWVLQLQTSEMLRLVVLQKFNDNLQMLSTLIIVAVSTSEKIPKKTVIFIVMHWQGLMPESRGRAVDIRT